MKSKPNGTKHPAGFEKRQVGVYYIKTVLSDYFGNGICPHFRG
jgi:hypothetical protein